MTLGVVELFDRTVVWLTGIENRSRLSPPVAVPIQIHKAALVTQHGRRIRQQVLLRLMGSGAPIDFPQQTWSESELVTLARERQSFERGRGQDPIKRIAAVQHAVFFQEPSIRRRSHCTLGV